MTVKKSAMKQKLELRRRLGVKYVNPPQGRAQEDPSGPVRIAAAPLPTDPRKAAIRSATPVPSGTPVRPQLDVEPDWCFGSGPKADALKALRAEICGCQACPLGRTRKRFVFGMGNPGARVLFIGEAPGADEDDQGLPFVGRAGQLLTKIIESTGDFKRPEVFIANVLKCRPPGNRPPQPEEVEKCLPHLRRQIAIIRPALILALGASAAQALLATKEAVGKLRNRWHEVEGIPLLVTYHPAALLRFEGYKKEVWKDMKEFSARYRALS